MPVHEGGNYKYNTLMGLLEEEHGFKGLKCVHRLDKQTSGIVFFARNEKTANGFREAMTTDAVKKEYLARVAGDFRIAAGGVEAVVKKWVFVADYKKMLHGCEDEEKLKEEQKKTAKEAETLFRFERYDQESDTSIIRCFPRTGRTHQIRVHLKSIGSPIAND
jgi:tRNA pseudouridine synthase 8/2,5-diamino-6-(5-phospho-D-ribitylamino)-pyrimidin-4(3H)-one deaminase